MTGDPFKKVHRGQELKISAEAYNAFIDAVRATRGQKQFGAEASQFFRQSGIVKVMNAAGFDQDRFAVLGVTEPIISPQDNEDEFKRQVTFRGVMPLKDIHRGRFVILLEPIRAGAIGLAVIAGVTPVKLMVDPANLYDYAEIEPNTTSALRNVPAGSARVLWIQPPDPRNQYLRWAVVRLDEGDYEAHVLITQNVPGADGYYPGVVQRYDVITRTWYTLFECKVVDINQ